MIGVNLSAFLGSWINIAFFGDTDTYNAYRAWFEPMTIPKVTCAGKFATDKYHDIRFLYQNHDGAMVVEKNEVGWMGRNSGFAAISLAYNLGAKRILLLGFDMKNSDNGDIHYHTGYPDKSKTPTITELKMGIPHPREKRKTAPYDKHMVGFDIIAKEADEVGIEIINLSPDSKIDCFKKMSVHQYLNQRENENETIPFFRE